MTLRGALQVLDTIVAAAVEEGPRNDPPSSPLPGSCYLIGTAPSGDWSGRSGNLGSYSDAGWRFIAPPDGLQTWVKSLAMHATYRNGGWELGSLRGSELVIGGQQVVGAQSPAIADPSGGAAIDAEARQALAAVLGALREHGLIAS